MKFKNKMKYLILFLLMFLFGCTEHSDFYNRAEECIQLCKDMGTSSKSYENRICTCYPKEERKCK